MPEVPSIHPQQPSPRHPWRLRFEPAQEAAYQQEQAPAVLRAVRLALAVALAGWLTYLAIDFVRFGHVLPPWNAWELTLLIARGLVLGPMLLMALLLRRPDASRLIRPLVALVLLSLFVGTAVVLALHIDARLGHERSVLMVLVLGVFLPIGLRFGDAVVIAVLCSLSIVPVSLLIGDSADRTQFLRLVLVLLLTAALGAISAYLRERAQREQFLLRRQLEQLARSDTLTGLANRGGFDAHLRTCVAQAQRMHEPLALLVIDIDHFKRFNDSLGHPAGDEALRRVGATLQVQTMRPLDLAARLGGEELALLLYGVDPARIGALCERLLAAIDALAIAHPDSPSGPHLSVSLGAALLQAGESGEALYRRTDALLYRAKAEGRQRAVLDDTLRCRATDRPPLAACHAA